MAVIGADAGRVLQQRHGGARPRDAEGHGTHTASTAAGDRVDSATALRRRARPDQRHRTGRARDHVPRLPRRRAASAPTRSRPSSRRSSTASTSSTSRSRGGANPYTDPVELAFLDAFNAGIIVNASAGNAGPGAGTADHGGPWVTTVGASTSDRVLHVDAPPDAPTAARRSTRRRRRITDGDRVADAGRARRRRIPGEDALCQTPTRGRRGDRQDRRLPARRQRPRRQGLQRRCRAARPG